MYTFEKEAFNEKFMERLLKNFLLEKLSEKELEELVITMKENAKEISVFNGKTKKIEYLKVMQTVKIFNFEGYDRFGDRVFTKKEEVLYKHEKFDEDMCYPIDIYFSNSNNATTYRYYLCKKVNIINLAINGEFVGVLY